MLDTVNTMLWNLSSQQKSFCYDTVDNVSAVEHVTCLWASISSFFIICTERMNHLQICEYTKARCIKVTFEIFVLKLILATMFVTFCLVDVCKRKTKVLWWFISCIGFYLILLVIKYQYYSSLALISTSYPADK